MAANINFFNEDVSFKLNNKLKLKSWIKDVIIAEGFKTGTLNFIFCSDDYLLNINKQYLNHNTFTDIITFDNSEKDKIIDGDIFISYDRICDNSSRYGVTQTDELHRIIIHGTLHLLGYKDKTKTNKTQMTSREDFYLSLRKF